jgi:hypothetical protein
MTNSTPPVTPAEVLIAGSLNEIPVSIEQAEAVSARAAGYDREDCPYLGLYSWTLPPVERRLTTASVLADELEVHFRYMPDAPFDLGNPVTGLEVVVYDADGRQLSHQDYGVQADA